MAMRKFKPYTPGTRQRVVTDFSEITGLRITSAKRESNNLLMMHKPPEFY